MSTPAMTPLPPQGLMLAKPGFDRLTGTVPGWSPRKIARLAQTCGGWKRFNSILRRMGLTEVPKVELSESWTVTEIIRIAPTNNRKLVRLTLTADARTRLCCLSEDVRKEGANDLLIRLKDLRSLSFSGWRGMAGSAFPERIFHHAVPDKLLDIVVLATDPKPYVLGSTDGRRSKTIIEVVEKYLGSDAVKAEDRRQDKEEVNLRRSAARAWFSCALAEMHGISTNGDFLAGFDDYSEETLPEEKRLGVRNRLANGVSKRTRMELDEPLLATPQVVPARVITEAQVLRLVDHPSMAALWYLTELSFYAQWNLAGKSKRPGVREKIRLLRKLSRFHDHEYRRFQGLSLRGWCRKYRKTIMKRMTVEAKERGYTVVC